MTSRFLVFEPYAQPIELHSGTGTRETGTLGLGDKTQEGATPAGQMRRGNDGQGCTGADPDRRLIAQATL